MDHIDDERRRAQRYPVYIAAEIESDGKAARSALTKDASASGFMLLTRARLDAGQPVAVRVYLPDALRSPVRVTGRVARREPLNAVESGLWRQQVAVALDEPLTQLTDSFAELSRKQSALYKPAR